MEFADYAMYADDSDHHIDLRNPHFRQEAYMHMHHPLQHQQAQHDFFAAHMQHPHFTQHLASLTVDVKPRLTKEQHDILENHYQGQNKPNTQTKKGFAEALGVSLDKVNNWFQNRRAKSKQDAKKAASQYTTVEGQQTQSQGAVHSHVNSSASSLHEVGADDVSQQFLNSDILSSPNADSVDPLSLTNGLGITRADKPPTTMAPQDMLNVKPAALTASNLKMEADGDVDMHRRTLTQAQFDSFANASEYVTGKAVDSTLHESPKQEGDLFDNYLSDMGNFGASLDSNDMQAESNSSNFGSSSSLFPEVSSAKNDLPRDISGHSSVSGWSEQSTPSLGVTPLDAPDSGYGTSENDISPRGKSFSSNAAQWQPGQSIPCDFEAMEREFKEIAARNTSVSTAGDFTRRNSSIPFAEQQFAFANEQPYTQSDAPASLTQSMNNMGLSNDNTPRGLSVSSIGGGSIAARRQRPRPQPLVNTSLRSASYCGPLPTAPGNMSATSAMPPTTAPTLRRIKSSNVMNGGIASGRIQKSVSSAQRSPLNFTFAEAMSAPRFARRVSSYSPANGGLSVAGGSLAPPTPLSPTELSQRLELQRQSSQIFGARQLSRQPSINELQEESHSQMYSSPPATPNYPVQYGRNRLANGMIAENTPPQSAPASQQCFPSNIYSQAGHMPTTYVQAPMMTSQPGPFGPVLQTMQNVVVGSQPLQAGQYLEMLQAQQQMGGMGQLLPGSQPMGMQNYANMRYNMGGQTMFAPSATMGFPFVQGQMPIHHAQSKSVPGADFFVHEYSPPQDIKRPGSERKSQDSGSSTSSSAPKNYTFANHGPEHFEKSKKDPSASPGSSSGSSN